MDVFGKPLAKLFMDRDAKRKSWIEVARSINANQETFSTTEQEDKIKLSYITHNIA